MNREGSERGKNEKNWRFGHKKIIGPRPLGEGGAPGAPPPPGSASVCSNKHVNIYNARTFGVFMDL